MTKRRVMAIDDEEGFLQLLKLNLEMAGDYEVLTLSSAKDIIQKLYSFKPDVILLDIRMPAINGIEACEMLNKDPIGKKVPIIILSALDTDKDRLSAYKAGVVDYLIKPANNETIIAKINKALQFKN
jgi:CheY-like chemotaxis protein